ncbi:sulfatase-like hydrolase/transferase [Paenibacillus aurantius]|uniref:Sulfatase-like hydrolase/transferase n=1 Tax=Paenibacillus aurantius TaxID=2918900 RepID=A0AA96LAR8_9BACL|nr:sulfatase-like hydrolase/transferase [Paenibacillus aurantius]WNQ10206.1 sulfatase-like hydrolase/transferase [Paenibacillus aurantius]
MSRKPNILWICTDQQRFDTLGCYGNEAVRTPNIDRLARQGVLFEQAYCQSTVCAPSRGSFLTGRYPRTVGLRKNGANIPETEVLVTKLLHDGGYTCGLAGKLHLSTCFPKHCHGTERRIEDGYDQFHWSHHPADDWPTNAYSQWLRSKGKAYSTRPVDGCEYVVYGPDAEDHQAAWCAEKAIEFIDAHEGKDQSWLFSVNIFAPHHPFDPPEAYLRKYLDKLDQLPAPRYEEGELASKTSYQRLDHEGAYGNPKLYPFARMAPSDHAFLTAAYWAMVELIDDQVGRMLDALERSGQLEDTIVIFMSDHGELLGDHGVYLKGPHFYEPSVRVPLIVSWPGRFPASTRAQTMVELIDLAPTLLEAAGLPVYPGMQGKSMLDLLSGRTEEHREDVYCEAYETVKDFAGRGYSLMVRSSSAKIVLYDGAGEGELYDLENDPCEFVNLWHSPDRVALKLGMLERLCHRLAETMDPLPPRIAPW